MKFALALFLTLIALPLAQAADEIEVLGVARVNDGSPVAQAWNAFQKKNAELFKLAIAAQPALAAEAVRSAANLPTDGTTPAQWVIQLKPMTPLKPNHMEQPQAPAGGISTSSNFSIALQAEAQKDGVAYSFLLQQGGDTSDWVSVQDMSASDNAGRGTNMQNAIKLLRTTLEKTRHPLSADQNKAIDAVLAADSAPNLVTGWKAVAAKPDDKTLAVSFVQALKTELSKSMTAAGNPSEQKLMAILTPAQLADLGAPTGNTNAESRITTSTAGPGSFGVSMVSSPSKKSMTVTIDGMQLGAAFNSLIQTVNSSFGSSLTAPTIAKDLSTKLVSAKFTLDSADGALEKLANAAGAQLTKNGAGLEVTAGK